MNQCKICRIQYHEKMMDHIVTEKHKQELAKDRKFYEMIDEELKDITLNYQNRCKAKPPINNPEEFMEVPPLASAPWISNTTRGGYDFGELSWIFKILEKQLPCQYAGVKGSMNVIIYN